MRHVPRFLRLFAFVILALVAILPLGGCFAQRAQGAEQAYIVNSQGATAPTARSALAGSTAPGKQEIIGIYLPFIGTGLAVKAGLEWDGSPTVIEVPVASAPQAAPQCVEEQVTEYVPETRMVPRTRTIRRAVVPIPQAAPPCAPAPQAAPAPRSGCEPPPAPVACTDESCGVPGR